MSRHENRGIVTLKTIAEAIGVSQPVVSKVLHGCGETVRVGPATASKIEKLAKEMGYRANVAAKAMRSGRFGFAGLLLSTARQMSIMPDQLLNGILKGLTDHGLHLAIAQLPDEKLVSKGFIPKILRECLVDGLLINYNAGIPQAMIDLIGSQQIPAIWINSKQGSDCIYFDDFSGAQKATEHLLKLGHTRIAFANMSGWAHYSAEDRWSGYKAAMEAAGLKPQAVRSYDQSGAEKLALALRTLRGEDSPTAVLSYDFWTALVWTKAASQLGRRIPGGLSSVVISDRIESDVDVSLATCLLPEFDVGVAAVEMLIERIKNPAKTLKPRKIEIPFILGESTAPPGKY